MPREAGSRRAGRAAASRAVSQVPSITIGTGRRALQASPWNDHATDASGTRSVVDALVAVALQQRQDARGRKDFAAADAIRDQLATAGVVIEDTSSGPRWALKGES